MANRSMIQRHPRFPTDLTAEVRATGDTPPQVFALTDISLSGAFLQADQLPPRGSVLHVRLRPRNELLTATARVVHTIGQVTGQEKKHPTGIGIEFDPLAPEAQARLEAYLRELAVERPDIARAFRQRMQQEDRSVTVNRRYPRYVGGTNIALQVQSSDELLELWMQDISLGGLYIISDSPPEVGSKLRVDLQTPDGDLALEAEVVHVMTPEIAGGLGMAPGAGLQFVDLTGEKRNALVDYLAGRVPVLLLPDQKQAPAPGRLFNEVSTIIGRLFDGLDRGDLRAALGLKAEADQVAARDRLQKLRAVLSDPVADATPPQQARIETALKVLARLEQSLVLRGAPGTPSSPRVEPRPITTKIKAVIEESKEFESRGKYSEAWRGLRKLLEGSGRDTELAQLLEPHLQRLSIKIKFNRATQLLDQARESIQKRQKIQTIKNCREAARLLEEADAEGLHTCAETRKLVAPLHQTRLGILGLVLQHGASGDAVQIARSIVDRDPDCSAGWEVLFDLYRQVGHEALAKKAAAQLQRLRPEDYKLLHRMRRFIGR